jgi:8-oxo-dGTP pyrophosphatase MutT (NUDIX family)
MEVPRNFVAPPSPADRLRTSRATVRVLVLDPDGRVLLFQDSDPGVGHVWWETPGGGIDAGESEVETVVRELAEETGQDVDPDSVVGPLARRDVVHGYCDIVVDQRDAFYAVRVPAAFEVDTAGHTEEEQVTLLTSRWWSPAELAATDEELWPANLLDLLDLLRSPDAWPVPLPAVEESSVPA